MGNKTGEGLLMMMMVKKCIWNVQPDAAAHFFPSTQSMNHRADENAPRRCTRFFFFLPYRLALWWTFFLSKPVQCTYTVVRRVISRVYIADTYHKVMSRSTSDLCSACNLDSYTKWQWKLPGPFLIFLQMFFVCSSIFSVCYGHCFLSFKGRFLNINHW